MTMRLSPEEVEKVASLARLSLSAEEIERFSDQLSSVLDHVAVIQRLDTSNLAPTSHPFELENVLRSDELRPSVSRDEVLACAPSVEDGRFKVPPILGEAP